MKKKMIAVLTAALVFSMGTFAVCAEESPAAGSEAPVESQKATTTVAETKAPAAYAEATTVSEGYEVTAVSETTVASAKTAVQTQLNNVAAIGAAIGSDTVKAAATDSSKKVTATILTVVEVDPTTATPTGAGYEVTLKVAGIAAGDAIAVLHYTGSTWEVIKPSSVAAGSVTFVTSSLSPISVVKLDVTGVTESPKTGSSLPVAGVVLVICLAGAALCGKKYFA